MERGGANFLLSLCEGALTSFVVLPCPQKVQLQIISQLWEIPAGVNSYLRVPLQPSSSPGGSTVMDPQHVPAGAAPPELPSPATASTRAGLS